MSGAVELLVMVGGLHLLALGLVAVLIVPALRDQPEPPPPSGSGGDGGLRPLPEPPSTRPGGGLPLDDAVPARVRLREPGRLADLLPRRPRRGAPEPSRAPTPSVQ